MAYTYLKDKNVGDTVRIKEGGSAVDFLIVHKGNPDAALYDSSCDGIWVVRLAAIYGARPWDGTQYGEYKNDYENSDIQEWLKNDYWNNIDPDLREAIPAVRIPFKKGMGNAETGVYGGSRGLECKVFLLSGYEVGPPPDANPRFPVDGAKLSYFLSGTDTEANERRKCKSLTNNVNWWLRTSISTNDTAVWYVKASGDNSIASNNATGLSNFVRPAMILPDTLSLDSNNVLCPDSPPNITADKSGDLGTLTDGFDIEYSVRDEEDDPITVTESLDSAEIRSYTATPEQTESYSLRGYDWLKITNGSHTFSISATDDKLTAVHTVTFTRDCTRLVVQPAAPMEADDIIRFCSLVIDGAFPTDAILKCEVANNALDDEPVWEDCTLKVKAGLVYTFKNEFAEQGFAFSFRVSLERGTSGTGGYISEISGGFE